MRQIIVKFLPYSIVIALLMPLLSLSGQTTIIGEKGIVTFTSDAPLELIAASTNELKGVIDTVEMTFAFQVSMNSFEGFNNPLQRVHFQENYLETQKWPNATFQGKILDPVSFNSPGIYKVRTTGVFSIHGIDQNRIINGTIEVTEESVLVNSQFSVVLEDHKIHVPRIVNQKIAEIIDVSIQMQIGE